MMSSAPDSDLLTFGVYGDEPEQEDLEWYVNHVLRGADDNEDEWGEDDDDSGYESWRPTLVVRLHEKGVWHTVDTDVSEQTACGKAIAESDLTKTWHPGNKVCGTCMLRREYGSARTFILGDLDQDKLKTLSQFNSHELFDRSYLRRVMQELIGQGEAHVCAVTSKRRANMYRKGLRASCPDPKYHGIR